MKDEQKYEVIKHLVDTGGNKARAALKLGCSRSSVYRMIRGYKSEGKDFFSHGNTGRKPINSRSETERAKIISLYNEKYWDASYALFSELLLSEEKIVASAGLVRNILMREHILSPLATRKTRSLLVAHLDAECGKAKTKAKKTEIECRTIAAKDAHPHRSRCAYFGEMLQIDASIHPWFGDGKSALHAAIDDATGLIVGAYFDNEETLSGYYHMFHQILMKHGIPYMIFTDRRTVFEYRSRSSSGTENDTYTQFSYAMKQLGTDIKTSSIPQAKGRIERAFGTLQRRLPILFRMAGVKTLEQANEFLNHYIKEYNAKFALKANHIPSVFETQPGKSHVNMILAVLSPRTIDGGHAVKYMGKLYMPMSHKGNPVYFRKGSKGLVIKAFDGQLFFTMDDKAYALYEIPLRKEKSEDIDGVIRVKAKRKKYVPPMSHPWKRAAFVAHMKKQPHRNSDDNNPSNA